MLNKEERDGPKKTDIRSIRFKVVGTAPYVQGKYGAHLAPPPLVRGKRKRTR
jgi:hypothetical protein